MTYVDTARRCMLRLFELRSPYDMVGKHLHIKTMQWTELDSCFGRNGDSYYEYLLKGYILLNDKQLFDMFMSLYYSFDTYNKVSYGHLVLCRTNCIGMKCQIISIRNSYILIVIHSRLFGQVSSSY